jgi:hypothetical protein
MDRYQVLTAPLTLSGTGLEIAPYFYPLLDKAKHDVRYVDCIDNDTIAKKAAENPGATGREIPRIDWVWTPGKPLRSCIPADIVFDYCVATHVMEHVPDTIGQIFEVMRDGAVLALALPDRRYTMDYYRRETSLGDVVGNWINAPSRPTSAQTAECSTFPSPSQPRHGTTRTSKPWISRRSPTAKAAISTCTARSGRRRALSTSCHEWSAWAS